MRLRFSIPSALLAATALSPFVAAPAKAQQTGFADPSAPLYSVAPPPLLAPAPVAAEAVVVAPAPAPAEAVIAASAPQAYQAPLQSGYELTLEPITIYGNRAAATVMDVPANITVLDGATLQEQGVSDMKELTRYLPGVVTGFMTSGADPFASFSGFTIRGVGGNRVQMLVDGSRIPERVGDGTRDYLDFNFLRQVDVVRGPGSVLWGADALGGIVALETIDPEDVLRGETRAGRARLAYDSLDKGFDGNVVFAQQLTPDLGVMIGASHERAEEARLSKARADGGIYGCPRRVDLGATPCNELNPTEKETNRVLAKVVYTPNDAHRLEFAADVMRREMDVDYNQGLNETLRSFEREQVTRRQRYGVEHSWLADSPWADEIVTRFSWSPQSVDRRGVRRDVSAATRHETVTRDFTRVDEDFLELDVQWRKSFDLAGTEHAVTAGFDGDLTKLDYVRYNLTKNVTTGAPETISYPTNFADARTRRADLYLQDQISLFDRRLEVTPGLRLATYEIDPRPQAHYSYVPGSEPRKIDSQRLLGNLGAIVRLDDTYSVYGKAAQGFKMPTASQLFTSSAGTSFNQVPNPDLRPEKVNSFELGLRGQYDRGNFSVNGFYADYDDFIQGFYNVPGTADYTSVNLDKVKIWGLEASADWRLTENLTATAILSLQKGEQKSSAAANWTPHNVAPLTGTLGLSYEIPQADLTLQVFGTFADGVKKASAENLFKPPGYAVFDAHASWGVTEDARLNFSVLNIFDKRYFTSPMPYSYTIPASSAVASTNPLELQTQPGREFRVSLDLSF